MLTRPAAAVLLAAALVTGCASDTDAEDSTAAATPAATSATAGPTEVPTATAAPRPSATPTPAVRTVAVSYTGGEVAGTNGREEVALGEQVVLRFTSDVAEEIHVHGYDLETALSPGTPAELTLTADIPGVFEVELHESGEVLYQLRVS